MLSAKIRICSAISSRVSRCPPCTSRGANKRGRKFQQPLQLATHPFFPEHESSESVTLISKMHLERKNFIEIFFTRTNHSQNFPCSNIIERPDQPRKPNFPFGPHDYGSIPPTKRSQSLNTLLLLLLIRYPIASSYNVPILIKARRYFLVLQLGRGLGQQWRPLGLVGQRPCRVASPVGGIDSYAQTASY